MQVILLADIAKVGRKYAIVDVAPGYARNFLLARGLAEAVTTSNAARVASLTKKREEETKRHTAAVEAGVTSATGTELLFVRKADEEGTTYASVAKEEILAELATLKGIPTEGISVELEHPIKKVGTHEVTITGAGKKATVTVRVEAEKEEKEEVTA